jgi:hypothetical protein
MCSASSVPSPREKGRRLCVQSQSLGVNELWNPLWPHAKNQGVFALLTGYIDESYTGENEPVTFGLNCVYSTFYSWFWIEVGWKRVLDETNKQLIAAGRKPLRRYHSKELSNFEGDFEGWDGTERTKFTQYLLSRGINGNFIQSYGLTANLREVAQDWPRVKFEGVRRFGYHAMLRMIMLRLETLIPEQFGEGARIILIHERCEFDSVLLDAFNHYLRARPTAKSLFTSIAPMGWEDCIPLQPADFWAYEAMKETHRHRPVAPGQKKRERRLSLEAALQLESVGAQSEEIPRAQILAWKQAVEERDRKRGKEDLNNPSRFIKPKRRRK